MDIDQLSKETLNLIRKGYYRYGNQKIDLSLNTGIYDYEKVEVYSPTRLMDIFCDSDHFMKEKFYEPFHHQIKIISNSSFVIAKEYFRPLIMNLADAICPGGGTHNCAKTSEVKLCYSTSLYQSLSSQQASQVYLYNEQYHSPMHSDFMLLSPEVAVFRDEYHHFIPHPYPVSVLSIMPVNRFQIPSSGMKEYEIDTIMKMRIRLFFHVAARNMYRNLILVPLGCEEYGHTAYKLAQYFYELLIEEGYIDFFETIIFSFDHEFTNVALPIFEETFQTMAIQQKSKDKLDYTKLIAQKPMESIRKEELALNEYNAMIHKQSLQSPMDEHKKLKHYTQVHYPFPECNYIINHNNNTTFLGFTQGIFEDGIPFIAELMQEKNKKITTFFILPYIENVNQILQKTNNNVKREILKRRFDKKTKTDVWNSNLCQGMKYHEEKMEDYVMDIYISYLFCMNLLDLQKSDIEGLAHVLYDRAGHKVVAIELTLKNYNHVDVLVPLRFQPFTREMIIDNFSSIEK